MALANVSIDNTNCTLLSDSLSVARRISRSIALSALIPALVASVLTLAPGTSSAQNVPNLEKTVDFDVREQNVNDFLQVLFQEIGVPLSINADLEGNINGKFKDTAENVFSEVANAFDLMVYYDGAVAQAYRANQVSRRLIPVKSSASKRVKSIVRKMNLPDARNTISIEDSGLLVTGTDRFLTQVDEIIESVKRNQPKPKPRKKKAAPPPPAVAISFPKESPIVYRTFKLKHAWAVDTSFPVGGQSIVVPGVASILNQLILEGGGSSLDDSASGQSSYPKPLKGSGLASTKNTGSTTQIYQSASGAGPRIVADSRLNAIIIRDREEKMPAYQRLIDSLDVESGMVEIEATIIDVNTDKTRELGINWRYQDNDTSLLFGSGTGSDQSLIPGSDSIAQGRGGVLSFMLGEPRNFMARIRLLEEQGAARVVSKPHVITLSDVEAVLAATTEFFVRVAGEEEVDLFNVPVGTVLRVTPHVFADNNVNKIKLLVNIEDGSQSPGSQVDNIPVIERANISTQAVVTEGDSLLVGGLVRETYRNTRYQVPVLGRVPLLGALFRSKQNQANRVERLFLITPRLAAGFTTTGQNTALLQGNQNRIIQDAPKRISATTVSERPKIEYWNNQSANTTMAPVPPQQPERSPARQPAASNTDEQMLAEARQSIVSEIPASEAITRQMQRDTTANASTAQAMPDTDFAVIENNVFKTPFTVEAW